MVHHHDGAPPCFSPATVFGVKHPTSTIPNTPPVQPFLQKAFSLSMQTLVELGHSFLDYILSGEPVHGLTVDSDAGVPSASCLWQALLW